MAGSRKALDEWIRRTAPRAIAYASLLLPRAASAEDVVQEVYLRLLQHSEYDLPRDGEKLLFRSVTNACINATTRRRELLALDRGDEDGFRLLDTLADDSEADPADVAASRELMREVEAELARITPMKRAAVELKALGKSLKEIAEVLDVSVQNAGVLVHRGRRELKERLGESLPGALR